MRRTPLLLALAALAAGGCGQKGPLYLPDKVGKVVTSPPPVPQAQATPATPATTPLAPTTPAPATTPPAGAAPAAPPKPTDKDQEPDSQPPK